MRTITQTEFIIRLFFLICIFSGALLTSIFSEKETNVTSTSKPAIITLHQQSGR